MSLSFAGALDWMGESRGVRDDAIIAALRLAQAVQSGEVAVFTNDTYSDGQIMSQCQIHDIWKYINNLDHESGRG